VILWVPSSSWRTRCLFQIRSDSLSRNDRITFAIVTDTVINGKRYCPREPQHFTQQFRSMVSHHDSERSPVVEIGRSEVQK